MSLALGLDPRITFFSVRDRVLVSAGSHGSIGTVFYSTANAGPGWMAEDEAYDYADGWTCHR